MGPGAHKKLSGLGDLGRLDAGWGGSRQKVRRVRPFGFVGIPGGAARARKLAGFGDLGFLVPEARAPKPTRVAANFFKF